MLVAPWSGSLLAWEQELAAFKSQLSSAFGRAELRRSASVFIDGLLSGVARKTGWQLAGSGAALPAAILAGPQFLAGRYAA
jgi:hypothetical protein